VEPFQCRYGCGTWLHTDPDILSKNGKLIPLQENNLKHDCHLNPHYRRPNKFARARAVSKSEIKKIEKWAELKGEEF
jgi:hypothetical protein